MRRSERREILFKLLFRTEFVDISEMPEQMQMYFSVDYDEEKEIPDEIRDEIIKREEQIMEKLPEIDKAISERATGWTIDRMGKVDLAIIRLAVFEILFDDEIPVGVSINEAVELAKKYGREESGGFVNGVLAKFAI
ncbi:MAG: transcription antitermination factor NusB [Lachnospiraceae bacterium]|nr:transcription antitermination factor NusB [Lachnospiraceae bacterium]